MKPHSLPHPSCRESSTPLSTAQRYLSACFFLHLSVHVPIDSLYTHDQKSISLAFQRHWLAFIPSLKEFLKSI